MDQNRIIWPANRVRYNRMYTVHGGLDDQTRPSWQKKGQSEVGSYPQKADRLELGHLWFDKLFDDPSPRHPTALI